MSTLKIMMDAPVPASVPRTRFWRRVVVAGVWAAVVLGVLVGVFHRPLLRWGLDGAGRRLAARAGLVADWQLSGSMLGGLELDGVTVTGGGAGMLRSLTVHHAALTYDVSQLWSKRVGQVLERVVIDRLVAEIDLTRRSASDAPAAAEQPSRALKFPSLRLPVIEIKQVSLRVRYAGGVVEIDDFSVRLDPARPGQISLARLKVPGWPEMRDARGVTRAKADSVTIEECSLWPETGLDRLVVDLAALSSGRIGVGVAGYQGAARAEGEGVVSGLPGGLMVDFRGQGRQLTNGTLARWGVADGGVDWHAGDVSWRVDGPVRQPQALTAEVVVRGAAVTFPGVPVAAVDLTGRLRGGQLDLEEARATAGRTRVQARGRAALPARWMDVPRAAGGMTCEVQSDAIEEWMTFFEDGPSGVRGAATVTAGIDFAGGAWTRATVAVQAVGLDIHGLPVEKLTAGVSSADGREVVATAECRLNENNTLSAKGTLTLTGDQTFAASWNADCRDLATVPTSVRSGLPWPTAGIVASSGAVEGTLKSVREHQWAGLNASATVDASALKVRDASLKSARLQVRATGGTMELETMAVELDEKNSVTGRGSVRGYGAADSSVSTQWRATLLDVAGMSAWSTSFGGPALRGGTATADWVAGRQAGETSISGSGSVQVQGIVMEGFPEAIGLQASLTQSSEMVTMDRLVATAGPWRTEGSILWNGRAVVVPQMTCRLGGETVATLEATVPVRVGRGPVAAGWLAPDEPMAVRFTVDPCPLEQLGSAWGHSWPVRGRVAARGGITGTPRSPMGEVSFDFNELRSNRDLPTAIDPARVTVKAVMAAGRASVEASAVQPPLQPLTLTAEMPVDLVAWSQNPQAVMDTPVTGRFRLPPSSLAFLPDYVRALQSIKGTVAVDGTIRGTTRRPAWEAAVAVDAPAVVLAGAALPSVRDLSLRIRSDEKRIVIDQASVMVAGGRLRLEGGADLARWGDPELDFTLRADEVLVVRDEALSLRADAALTCRGPVSRAAVGGTVELVRGRVFKEIEFLPLSLPNQLPPPPTPTMLARSGPPALPPPFDRWELDVGIRTRDPVRLMGNVARGSVVADFRLTGNGARPVLVGRATLQQMWIKLPFRRLTITEGELVLTEDKPFDPQIRVIGESIMDGRVVEVAVEGRALDPGVRLTSSPPLPEGEIAALLATGVTTSDLGTRGDEAAGRAAYVLMQQTYRKLFRQSARAADDDEPPRLSLEFSLFGSDPSRRGVSAIYELNPHWRVIGRVGETGTFRGLLHYLIRFR